MRFPPQVTGIRSYGVAVDAIHVRDDFRTFGSLSLLMVFETNLRWLLTVSVHSQTTAARRRSSLHSDVRSGPAYRR